MKKIVAVLALLVCLAAHTALAGEEVVFIDGEGFPYSVPEDLSPAEDIFPLHLEELDKKFRMQTYVFGVYVPAEFLSLRTRDPWALPEYYLQLSYDGFFSTSSLGDTGFSLLTGLADATMGYLYRQDDFKSRLEAVFRDATQREVSLDSLEHLGCIDKRRGVYTMLGTGNARVRTEAGLSPFPFAMATTLHLTKGKVICTIQIGHMHAPEDVDKFRQKALATATSLWGLQ